MTDKDRIVMGKDLLRDLSNIIRELQDDQILTLFGEGALDEFLNSIMDPTKVSKYSSIGNFFMANKNRSAIMAGIRSAITRSCAIKVKKKGKTAYVSPTEMPWFDDAVIVLEGKGPFEGLICKYQDDSLSYAIPARDIIKGEKLGKDDFQFVDIKEVKNYLKTTPKLHDLEVPIKKLKSLLEENDSSEVKYQELLEQHPWIFGLQYKTIQRHSRLDDQNIPDFTGVRITDNYRDIFEIKPPSMDLFRADNEFTNQFNSAWNQAERYLNLARRDADYLRRKGFLFDNPKCFLICGYNLPSDGIEKLRVKECMNPAIQILTYNDLITYMISTADFVKKMAVQ